MKIIIKRIAIVLLCMLLVCSLTLNIILLVANKHDTNHIKTDHQILGVDNGTILLKDNQTQRAATYSLAFDIINDSDNITINNINMEDAEHYVKETLTCFKNDEKTNYICKMSSTLYDLSHNVVRQAYFPGDGYKYTIENNVKTKIVASNEVLETYLLDKLLSGTIYCLYYLAYNPELVPNLSFLTYINYDDTNLDNLTKDIIVTYNSSSFNLRFDQHGALIELYMHPLSVINFSYDLVDLDFPSFEGFVEQQGGDPNEAI